MNKKEIVERVENYLKPITDGFNYEIVDVEFIKEGPTFYLRLYIDKEEGITIDDCKKTSRAIEAVLDENDPIEVPYVLEVSSPGLDRIIKKDTDFERFNGQVVDVKLYEAINKQKKIQGVLKSKDSNMLVISDENDEIIEIPIKNIVQVRLAILF
ncbi:MAG: ribosome maturation factor RimP [Cellulosilyticaceae bacterium]